MKRKPFVLAALVLAFVALSVAGAGWKWQQPCHGHAYGPERIAGWTWEESAVFAD